jgi:hypothetical protein
MMQEYQSTHFVDSELKCMGGAANGPGIQIRWQAGPLRVTQDSGPDIKIVKEKEPNGAFVETVIAIALDRIAFYQATRFACEENEDAMDHLAAALSVLDERTQRRTAAGTEGTHVGN